MMKITAPQFWQQPFHLAALLLWPLGEIYKIITYWRLRNVQDAPRSTVPVICVGNVTVGGTGKTPIVQYIVHELQKQGKTPHILLRGYGGKAEFATRVDLATHDAYDVGDEALLHAAIAPTWVGRDRFQSAQAAIAAGADIIVMDDGLQNATIRPSMRWLVVDAARGIGNGYGVPAGPLREDFDHAIKRVDVLVLVGDGAFSPKTKKPLLRVKIQNDEASRVLLKDKQIYAFAGIGHPEKLAATLRGAGLDVTGVRGFPDHHNYKETEIQALHQRAKLLGAQLVTTKKDYVRLPESLRDGIVPVDVKITCDQPELFRKLVLDAIHAT